MADGDQTENKSKIKGLNTLRFVAFFWVFFGHATPFNFSYFEVYIFFVLSSFLLTYLALIELNNTGKFSKTDFFVRRALRIYPLYYFVVIGCFLLIPYMDQALHTNTTLPEKKYLYLLFLSNYDYSDHIFALKFFWSIAVQEQFYLLFMPLSLFFKRNIYIPVIILSVLYVMGQVIGKRFELNFYTLTTSYFPHFACGIVAGNLFFHKRVPKIRSLVNLFCLGILLCLITVYIPDLKRFIEVPIAILITIFILVIVQLFDSFPMNNKFIKVTEHLGKYTFGLYVFSGFIITITIKIFEHLNPFVQFGIECMALYIVAWFSYNLFEKHFIRLKKHFKNR
jgi:peptidoglycan/LPS O-acetylase OafA/YrhL